MATWTHGVTITDTTDGVLFTSGSFTPAVGDLLVVSMRSSGSILTPVVTGSTGLTFALGRASATATFLFVANALATADPQTISIDFTGDDATSLVCSVDRLSGMVNVGAAAIRQSADTSGSGGVTPAITFPGNPIATNPVIAFLGGTVNPPSVSPPFAFIEQIDTGIGVPATGLEVATLNSSQLSPTVTWGSVSGSAWRGIIAEFDAPIPPAIDNINLVHGMGPMGKARVHPHPLFNRVKQ